MEKKKTGKLGVDSWCKKRRVALINATIRGYEDQLKVVYSSQK